MNDNNPTPVSIVMGWQEIGTAPLDGRDLLLTSSDWNGDVVAGSFAFGKWRDRPSPEGASMTPTHWMPLPAPPALSATATEGE